MNTQIPDMNHRFDCHLCLVSAQAVPNITPLLDPQFKPKEVILLVSPNMVQRADWLKAVIQPTGVKVSTWGIERPWDIQHVQDRVMELLGEGEALGQSMPLNATGGTKPMSIAAYEVFRAEDKPVFYVHPERDRVIWLSPASSPGHDLADRIKLEAFLGAYGTTCKHLARNPINSGHRELTEELVQELSRWAMPLRKLNWYAQQAGNNLQVNLDDKDWTEVEMLSERFELQGLLRLTKDKIVFPDEESRFFVNGGWFEEYVYALLFNLRKDIAAINDLARNIEVARKMSGTPVRNEIDVAFLADNRLYIIECKTRGWKQDKNAGSEAIYKLDTLKEMLGGLQGKAMLVSYQQLDKATRNRAKDLGIECCSGADVQHLREKIMKWVSL